MHVNNKVSFSRVRQNQDYFQFSIKVSILQGVPKKIGILSSFDFLGLGGVFLGVKNNSKNFGKKTI